MVEDLIKRIDELFWLVEHPSKIKIIDKLDNKLLDTYLLRLKCFGNIDNYNEYKEKLENLRKEK